MVLSDQLDLLLGDFSKLSARIKHLNFDSQICGDKVNVNASYISFRDGVPTFDEFIEVVSQQIISFCLPREEIQDAFQDLSNSDHVAIGQQVQQLSSKARNLFIKAKKGSHRSGEAGEIVLYILNEWRLKAPQIVSKMYLKTNNNMPVHGTDGIHARYDEETKKLLIYWGESKAHKTLKSALDSALSSISDFITNGMEEREIEIVSDFINLAGLSEDAQSAFLRYLDPYADESNERIAIFSCLLVFDYNIPHDKVSEEVDTEFVKKFTEYSAKFIADVNELLTDAGLNANRFEFFLLPVPSVQIFRDKFQAKIGWPND